MQPRHLTKEQALQKLKQYCSYQERCHSEVRQKLFQLCVYTREHDEIISSLIQDDYLNEERFAMQYAGGKFRMKQWGLQKIKYALKEKQVSDYCIKKALKEIGDEYHVVLKKLAEKKYASLKSEQYLVRKKKTTDYLIRKGYEADLVYKLISEIASKK